MHIGTTRNSNDPGNHSGTPEKGPKDHQSTQSESNSGIPATFFLSTLTSFGTKKLSVLPESIREGVIIDLDKAGQLTFDNVMNLGRERCKRMGIDLKKRYTEFFNWCRQQDIDPDKTSPLQRTEHIARRREAEQHILSQEERRKIVEQEEASGKLVATRKACEQYLIDCREGRRKHDPSTTNEQLKGILRNEYGLAW